MRSTLFAGHLDAAAVAKRLGCDERTLRRNVADRRWDLAPEPAGEEGRVLWWHAPDVDAWLGRRLQAVERGADSGRGSRLRIEDVADRLHVHHRTVRDRLPSGRNVPLPAGRDDRGLYWDAREVDAWLIARSPAANRA